MARADRVARVAKGAVGGQLPTAAARLTSTGVPCETSKRCTLIELSTLGLGTTTAGPPMPDGPPMVDADPSVRVGLGQTLKANNGTSMSLERSDIPVSAASGRLSATQDKFW